jgi:3-deoxy-D-manno-octulosonic-acid transferase
MRYIYNLLIGLTKFILPLVAIFNRKMRLFIKGRAGIFKSLEQKIKASDKVIWMHCASLGEFEQGRPILESLKDHYPNYKLLLTFFSPSGYEIRKNYDRVDVVAYLPLDTPHNAVKFIEIIHPELAIFVKYEFWPNILQELKSKNIKTILISGIFRENQVFFKTNFSWYRNQLNAFSHFFVQDKTSVDLLHKIGFKNVSLAGDTRFDRVYQLVLQKKEIPFFNEFSANATVLIAGSTWLPDQEILTHYINESKDSREKFILAPHNIHNSDIDHLKRSIRKNVILYSQINSENVQDAQVIIIDSIGLLSAVYAYATIAYIGGGFGTGIHNVLEPATYGIPIFIGPKYHKFKEAKDLIALDAIIVINSKDELTEKLVLLKNNKSQLSEKGLRAKQYVIENKGAGEIILKYINNIVTL